MPAGRGVEGDVDPAGGKGGIGSCGLPAATLLEEADLVVVAGGGGWFALQAASNAAITKAGIELEIQRGAGCMAASREA